MVAEGAGGEVGALGDVEEFVHVRAFEYSAGEGPEPAEDAEEGALAAAVGSADDCVHASVYFEGDLWDEDVAVGGDDGYFVEDDEVFGLFCFSFLDIVDVALFLHCVSVDDLCAYEASFVEVT